MRVACVGYRKWALNIYDFLCSHTDHDFLITRNKDQFREEVIQDFNPDIILFYGWSWLVPENLYKNYMCLMLHPSPLPKYRGGSPIQNQIIAGETKSKVSIFVIDKEVDAGDLISQGDLSLEGSLAEILKRIEVIGIDLTINILKKQYQRTPQDHSQASYCARRSEKDSEITLQELINQPAIYLYNKIRMLDDPYPNAYIKTADNKRLILKVVKILDGN